MKIIALFFSLVFAVNFNQLHAQETKLQLFDVSILFPLPESDSWNDLLGPTTAENLLPFSLFEKIPYLLNQPNEKTYPLLRVIGVRVDPCFSEGPPPAKCHRHLRMIWQPLANLNGVTSTIDSTLHTFFEFEDAEFADLVLSLRELHTEFAADYVGLHGRALGVHPLLQKYGLKSAYAQKLKAIVLRAVADKKIKRITFMKLKGMNDFWVFGGMDLINGEYQSNKIPRLEEDALEQEFINQFAIRPNPTSFRGGIFPSPSETDIFNLIAKDAAEADGVHREQDIRNMVRSIADFEHPARHNPGTLDCVTCHLANTMRAWVNKNLPELKLEADYDAVKYTNAAFNLNNTNPLQAQTNNLRMFGYIGQEPVLGQRTINESAEVVRFLEAR